MRSMVEGGRAARFQQFSRGALLSAQSIQRKGERCKAPSPRPSGGPPRPLRGGG
jgi:hypothetical protein